MVIFHRSCVSLDSCRTKLVASDMCSLVKLKIDESPMIGILLGQVESSPVLTHTRHI